MTRSEKIKILLNEGYPPKQAIAIAYQMIPKKKKRTRKKSIYRSENVTAWEAQQRRKGGTVVNPTIETPDPFCDDVDSEKCLVCGEYYKTTVLHAGGVAEATQRIRQAAGGWDKGGGYRTRGPLLWAMHVLKLEAWYMRHLEHCWMVEEYNNQGLIVPFPPSVVWALDFGTPKIKKQASLFMDLYEARQKETGVVEGLEASMVSPTDYTKQMNAVLNGLQLSLNKIEKKRKKYGYPNRQEQFKEWEKEMWSQKGDIPF